MGAGSRQRRREAGSRKAVEPSLALQMPIVGRTRDLPRGSDHPSALDALSCVTRALRDRVRFEAPLADYTTLRVGGPAEAFLRVRTSEELTEVVLACRRSNIPWFLLGGGSNLCVSDRGVPGLVIHNRNEDLIMGEPIRVGTGHSLAGLFRRSVSHGLVGLEFAVGIPGTIGGALVSNAGAYRRSIAPLVRSLEIIDGQGLRSVGPEWMEFGYRDSRLRRSGSTGECLVSVELDLVPGDREGALAEARGYQRNRIFRQPWAPSAGSFFKNVYDVELARRIPGLPKDLREAGVVPAGYLSAECGCKGMVRGGCAVSPRHGNFIVNLGSGTAADVRALADEVRRRVHLQFGVMLEEEVLYVGEW